SSQPHVEGIVGAVCPFMQQLRNTIPGEIEAAVTQRFTDKIFQGLYHSNFSICRDRSIADGGSLGRSSTCSKPIEFTRQHCIFQRQTRNAGNDRKCVAILRTEPAVAALNESTAADRRNKLRIHFRFSWSFVDDNNSRFVEWVRIVPPPLDETCWMAEVY